MKTTKLLTVLAFISTTAVFAQKKTNGTVYIDHPAITVVEDMTKAFVAGDSTKVASYLADDFKSFNGVGTRTNDKGRDKASFLRGVKWWKDAIDYFSITRTKGAYPDAIEYKEGNQKDVVWVQTWEDLKGVHKTTGVKINMPVHRLYVVNKNNKIQTLISYSNESVFDEIGVSYGNRTNGTIYNHHDNINTVRKLTYAYENGDLETTMSFYSDDARFNDINDEFGKSYTKAETKASWAKFLKDYEIVSIDMIGYPDYLEYEMNDGREVLSWWNYHLIRKSDKKAISIPFHFSNSFDADGKIVAEMAYYSQSLLTAK
ncbi:nuclear transport factor 2 family protein [Mariniflexile gromovii]|uniref:Nuclear transport factor 2 family protein n=1 Tax=Mariniflexile gromovii TaxID=362523 RepID=A0ABS4BTL8_9FLAO|nr:nuclear transport factor 2 family protein [Mariniflexile gromovii]MBP0903929.1 nuclear transport factor 2 family protein [Mariniflexile gromovii]